MYGSNVFSMGLNLELGLKKQEDQQGGEDLEVNFGEINSRKYVCVRKKWREKWEAGYIS